MIDNTKSIEELLILNQISSYPKDMMLLDFTFMLVNALLVQRLNRIPENELVGVLNTLADIWSAKIINSQMNDMQQLHDLNKQLNTAVDPEDVQTKTLEVISEIREYFMSSCLALYRMEKKRKDEN